MTTEDADIILYPCKNMGWNIHTNMHGFMHGWMVVYLFAHDYYLILENCFSLLRRGLGYCNSTI